MRKRYAVLFGRQVSDVNESLLVDARMYHMTFLEITSGFPRISAK